MILPKQKYMRILNISGRVERRFDKYQIVVNSIKILE